MVSTTDPPSAEQKFTEFWKTVRGFIRRIVTRRTLMTAIFVLVWTVRAVRLLKLMFGGF